jgi:hypothetical protein
VNNALFTPCTAFEGHRRLSSGPLIEVALAVKSASERGGAAPILAFDDATGGVIDFDLRGGKADWIARLSASVSESAAAPVEPPAEQRGRGRPKLGVIAREVTLLPRHWEWLAAQPGGASAALRRLVHEAQRTGGAKQQTRAAQEAAYRFMSAMAGDFPAFEEAARALFGNDAARFEQHVAGWPGDVRDYASRLAFGAGAPPCR